VPIWHEVAVRIPHKRSATEGGGPGLHRGVKRGVQSVHLDQDRRRHPWEDAALWPLLATDTRTM